MVPDSPTGPQPGSRYWLFGPYVLDRVKNQLIKDGVAVPVRPKDLEILIVLVDRHGRLVEKDEIFACVWSGAIVEEGNLSRHISTLRKTLNGGTDRREYIATLPARGYRFVAEVTETDEDPHATHTTPVPGAVVRAPVPSSRIVHHVAWVAVCAALVIFFWPRPSAAPTPRRTLVQVTDEQGVQEHPSWSPDGQRIVYASDHAGVSNLYVRTVADHDALPIQITSSASSDWQPDWSPDGRWIAFRSERDGGGLRIVPAEGGPSRGITTFGYDPQWSPDSRRVLFMSAYIGQLGPPRPHVIAIGDETPAAVAPQLLGEFNPAHVAWHPDGRISIWGRRTGNAWAFVTVDPATGAAIESPADLVREVLTASSITLSRFRWAPSGRHLYFEGESRGVRNIWRVTVDPATLAWTHGPDRLTTTAGEEAGIALSPDGRRLLFSAQASKTRIWALSFDHDGRRLTGRAAPLTTGRAGEQSPNASAGGGVLVYGATRAGRYEFRERSMHDSRDRVLLAGYEHLPRMSQDGARLAYLRQLPGASGTDATTTLVTRSLSGGEERVLATFGPYTWVPTDWAPDGSALVGTGRTADVQRGSVFLLPLSGAPHGERHMRLVATGGDRGLTSARFSPDQHWVAFAANNASRDGTSVINVVSVSGGAWTRISEGAQFDGKPQWAPDGRAIYYISNRDGFVNVWGRRFDPVSGHTVGPAFRVTDFDSSQRMLSAGFQELRLAFTDDSLILPITERSSDVWMLEHVDQ